MAERFNDIQAQRAARAAEFSGLDEVAPPDLTDIGAPQLFDTEGLTADPQWGIVGVAPQRVDIFAAVIEEPIERWPGRLRPAGFPKVYTDLDPVFNADLIYSEGLTYDAPSVAWIGYYPGLSSNTGIGKVSPFIVGSSATFTVFGVSLAGTAYAPNYSIYGKDFGVNGAATQFTGTITAVNSSANTITVTATALNREILLNDTPSQKWKLTPSGVMTEPNNPQ